MSAGYDQCIDENDRPLPSLYRFAPHVFHDFPSFGRFSDARLPQDFSQLSYRSSLASGDEGGYNISTKKISYWMTIFEMELKYLEGQTDALISALRQKDSYAALDDDVILDDEILKDMISSAKARLQNFENCCKNFVSNQNISSSMSDLSSRSQRTENDMPSELDALIESIRRKDRHLLSFSSLTRDEARNFIKEQNETILEINERLSRLSF